jgi:hypothetical protein
MGYRLVRREPFRLNHASIAARCCRPLLPPIGISTASGTASSEKALIPTRPHKKGLLPGPGQIHPPMEKLKPLRLCALLSLRRGRST